MLNKLLKNDLKKNMRLLWILFIATIAIAVITRSCKEIGKTIAFFQVVGIFFRNKLDRMVCYIFY